MKLNKLPKIKSTKKKRIGRGIGSGKGGHTSSRGQKGQKSRGSVGILFEGTKMRKSLIKKMPFLRGKGKFKAFKKKPIIINLKYLNLLPAEAQVDINILAKYNLVKEDEAKKYGVKILGDGEISKKLVIKLPISGQAAAKIEKAGGKIEKPSAKDKNEKEEEKVEKKTEVKGKTAVKKTAKLKSKSKKKSK